MIPQTLQEVNWTQKITQKKKAWIVDKREKQSADVRAIISDDEMNEPY